MHICVEKFVPADLREGVQMFQRRSKFSSEISSGGSIFLEKLVPGGTNLGGSIFTVTCTPISFPDCLRIVDKANSEIAHTRCC